MSRRRIVDFPSMVELLPEGEAHGCRLEHFEISENEARLYNLRAAINRHRGAFGVKPGRFVRLRTPGGMMMSDCEGERITNYEGYADGHGRILIGGLGLGMLQVALARCEDVEHITVIEIEQGVIDLVAPHLPIPEEKITIIQGDVLDWRPPKGERWNCIWFDIWPTICTDNLEEINRLHQRFKGRLDRTDPGCWMRSWMADMLRDLKRRGH